MRLSRARGHTGRAAPGRGGPPIREGGDILINDADLGTAAPVRLADADGHLQRRPRIDGGAARLAAVFDRIEDVVDRGAVRVMDRWVADVQALVDTVLQVSTFVRQARGVKLKHMVKKGFVYA